MSATTERKSRDCLLLFLKAPEAGKVKTRLAREMTPELAAELYRCFVEDIAASVVACEETIRIFFHPPESGDFIREWLGHVGECRAQGPGSLGMKMARAFTDTFGEGYTRVLLMGTDIPDLPIYIIREGFAALATQDAVIGPTFDGGYYLIGLKPETYDPDLFAGIPWSTDTVLTETLSRFRRKGRSVHQLPRWRDIDTRDDLKQLIAGLEKTSEPAVTTARFLRILQPWMQGNRKDRNIDP
ncbi:MAG: TIGR04282 family arsenosugar biosynthesis glycosyltransferase [Thermodesulfobacteriota bacterium]